MSHYGYEIVQTLIVDIEPDNHVKRAMNEINAGKILDLLNSYFLLVENYNIYNPRLILQLSQQLLD